MGYVLAEVPSGSSKKVRPYAAPVYTGIHDQILSADAASISIIINAFVSKEISRFMRFTDNVGYASFTFGEIYRAVLPLES